MKASAENAHAEVSTVENIWDRHITIQSTAVKFSEERARTKFVDGQLLWKIFLYETVDIQLYYKAEKNFNRGLPRLGQSWINSNMSPASLLEKIHEKNPCYPQRNRKQFKKKWRGHTILALSFEKFFSRGCAYAPKSSKIRNTYSCVFCNHSKHRKYTDTFTEQSGDPLARTFREPSPKQIPPKH